MIISNFTVSLSHYKDAELYSLWSVIVLLSDESSRHFCSGLTDLTFAIDYVKCPCSIFVTVLLSVSIIVIIIIIIIIVCKEHYYDWCLFVCWFRQSLTLVAFIVAQRQFCHSHSTTK